MTTPVREQRTQDDRQELTALIAAAVAQLTRTWSILHTSQTTLLQQLERIESGRVVGQTRRIREALAQFNAAIGEYDRRARALTERWAAQDLPIAYRDGAVRALRAAERDEALFTWTTEHQAAITALTAPFWADLIRRITEAVRRAQAFARAAQDAVRAATGIDAAVLAAAHPLDTVVYANQARHPVHSWAQAALSWQGVVTANTGAINTARLKLGAEWMECVDGSECGFASHPDTDHADGTIRSVDDAAAYPVAHHGCVVEGTEVHSLGALESAYRLPVSGRMVEIRTAAGRRLTITPNHPILTGRGWIGAGEVKESDQVVVRSSESVAVPAASDLDQVPAPVEDVFTALGQVLPDDRVVPSAQDFHGDASMVDGEIQVVGTQGHLWRVADASGVQDGRELAFQMRDARSPLLSGAGHALPLGGAVASSSCSSVRRVHVRRVAGPGSDADASFLEATPQGGIRKSEFVRQTESRFSVKVALDDVVEVGYVYARGHVYDLSTTGHAYFANGILVHNCIREWFPRSDLNGRHGIVSGDPA
ncbi:hypothetical protein ACFV27_37325 [Streptomyces antimycoticus]|uniref:hypothetical protein n=1 Tax=Streptomyces antimycoticus TaxID=68175 RepID=UPI0036814110